MKEIKADEHYTYTDLIGCTVTGADTINLTLKHPDGRVFTVETIDDGYGWSGFSVIQVEGKEVN